jgi:hypothetical protein
MKYLQTFILIGFLLFSINASAEFYKYTDEEGNIRFTDDINQVPAEQRAKIQSYVESQSPQASEQEVTSESKENPEQSDQQANFPDLSEDDEGKESIKDAKSRIDTIKQEIDQEYEVLIKEKQKLAKDKMQAKSRQQIIEYNKRVENLNKRVEAYEKKGQDYEAQVEAYNQRLSDLNSPDQTQQ